MGVTGRKPKPAGQAVHRGAPVHDWTVVDDVPYTGTPPVQLPAGRMVQTKDGEGLISDEVPLHPLTEQWWRIISTMPHCVLWSTSDWLAAVDTALVADAFYSGHKPSGAELRMREKRLGVTADDRRDLRIRYASPAPEEAQAAPSGVTPIDRYRDL
jgi:hypothetical protein